MFYNGVFAPQVFPDQVFPDAPSLQGVTMVDLVGALNLQTGFGAAFTFGRPDVRLVGAVNVQTGFGGTITFGYRPTDLVGAVNAQFAVGGEITFTDAGQPPSMIDMTGSVNLTVTFSGPLLADNAGWIRRTSEGEGWTVIH